MSESLNCWKCGLLLEGLILPMSRREQCGNCHADQHVCKLCKHYRPQHSIFCEEERADPPAETETANFCDYFEPTLVSGAFSATDKVAAAKAELEALFGGREATGNSDATDAGKADNIKSGESKKEQALKDLNRLFTDKANGKT